MSFVSSLSESRSIEILARRSRDSSHLSRDSGSTVVVLSFRGRVLGDSETTDALATMQSCFNVDSTMTTRRLVEVPAASRDRGMPRRVKDFSFPDGAQLVVVSGSFLVGMLWVGYSGDHRVVHDLFPPKSRASRVLSDRSQWIPREWCAFQQ
ncbi:hypothetical protein BHE74_00043493 [Ensete ventricosum]|nr:hypothetical protein BHE74_00043493 [Ensete ventricosum]